MSAHALRLLMACMVVTVVVQWCVWLSAMDGDTTRHTTTYHSKALLQEVLHETREAHRVDLEGPRARVTTAGLWKGDAVGGDAHAFDRISIVVSHCLQSLDWIPDFTKGFVIYNITIISKCNATVVGAPPHATVLRWPNVGRCDHSYAQWIHDHVAADQHHDKDDDNHVVLFLKDDRSEQSIHQPGAWRSFADMLRITSKNNFACGMEPRGRVRGRSISAYHEWGDLRDFKIKKYESKKGKYKQMAQEIPFASPLHKSLGKWVDHLKLPVPRDLVEVCYAGTFAATTRQIRKLPITVWSNLTHSLSRGNNIEEGHYAERFWGGLLANPPTKLQVAALRERGKGLLMHPLSVWGALVNTNRGRYIIPWRGKK